MKETVDFSIIEIDDLKAVSKSKENFLEEAMMEVSLEHGFDNFKSQVDFSFHDLSLEKLGFGR